VKLNALIHIGLLGVGSVVAQQIPPSNPEPDSIQLREVLLIERRNRPSHGGLTPSSTIDAKALAQFPPVDYSGAFNPVPGVLLQSGALNTNRISIRGIGARSPFGTDKLRMYYNGIPVTNGTGVSVIEAFDLENLGQIELVKGPYGHRFGSPLGGAILLQSMDVTDPGEQVNTRTTLGSYGLFKNHSSYRYLDGRSQIALSYNTLQSLGYRENSQFDRSGLFLQGEQLLSSRSRLGVLLNYIDYFAQIPSSLSREDYLQNPRNAASNWLLARGFEQNQYLLGAVYHKWYLGGGQLLRTSVFYSYLDHYEARPFNILTDITQSLGARVEWIYKGRLWDFTLGAESYNDQYRWKTYENVIDPIGDAGSAEGDLLSKNREYRSVHFGFAQLNWRPNARWSLSGALNVNLSRYQFRNFFGEQATEGTLERAFDPLLLPKIEILRKLGTSELYFRAGQGYTNPGLEEALTPDGVLNPDIRQERGISYELGYRRMSRKWNLTINAFRMDVSDLLVARRFNEDQFIGINAGETRHLGLEASLRGVLGAAGKSRWEPRISYTLSDFTFTDFVDGDDDFGGNRIPGVPVHYVNTGLLWRHPSGIRMSWTHEYSDPIPLNDANSVYTDSYHLDRIQAGYRIELDNGWSFGLDLGVNNLFDVRYARSFAINAMSFGGSAPRFYYPGEPINFWGSIGACIRW